jgi:DnaJ-class molecular chaperone
MQKINQAKEILINPKKRQFYDKYGLEGIKSGIIGNDSPFPGPPQGPYQFYCNN